MKLYNVSVNRGSTGDFISTLFKYLTILSVVVFSTSCETVDRNKRLGLLSFAVVGEEVLVGRTVTYGEDGTFELNSLTSNLACLGRFRSRGSLAGRINYKCSNGMTGKLRFSVEGLGVGSGQGLTDLGPAQLVFGYRLDQANHMLDLPNNMVLAVDENDTIILRANPSPL